MRKYLMVMVLVAVTALAACHKVDDDRIPPRNVYVPFDTEGTWNLYGVAGATSWRRFVKELRLPAGYNYPALAETGYGGVLLACDILGEPQAYDLACPVERRPNVRVEIDGEQNVARCPECESTYDVFSNYGTPLSGPAADRGYALRRYHVSAPTPMGIPYRAITF